MEGLPYEETTIFSFCSPYAGHRFSALGMRFDADIKPLAGASTVFIEAA